MICLTKSDLIDFLPDDADLVTEDDITAKKNELGLQGALVTSSKEWEDFNVHKAFARTLMLGYEFKNR